MIKTTIISAAIATLISGCALQAPVQKEIDESANTSTSFLKNASDRSATPFFQHVSGIYLADKLSFKKKVTIPAAFNKSINVDEVKNLSEFAAKITRLAGIHINITPEAQLVASSGSITTSVSNTGQSQSTNTESSAPQTSSDVHLPPSPIGSMGQVSYNSQSSKSSTVRVPGYSGTLEGYLSEGTAAFGVFWKVEDDGNVTIFFTDTKQFTLNAPQTSRSFNSEVGQAGSASTTSASSTVSATTTVNLSMSQDIKSAMSSDPFADTVAAIKDSMLTKGYGKITANRSTNTIVVHDIPSVLDQVEKFVADQNKKLNSQVYLHVKVYDVQRKNGDQYGLNWSALYAYLSKTANVAVSSSYAGFSGVTPSSIAFNVLSSSTSPWAGSSMVAEALSTQGDVSVVTSLDQAAFVNRPTPIQSGETIIYVCGQSTTSVASAGVTNSVNQCSIDTGIKMTLIPAIVDGNKIQLEVPMDLTTLLGWSTIGSGTSAVQVPLIDNRKISPSAEIRSGETVVFSGLEQSTNQVTKQGVGTPDVWVAGGGRDISSEKDYLVIVITASVMN